MSVYVCVCVRACVCACVCLCTVSSRDTGQERKICGHSRKLLLGELFKEIRKNRLLQKLAAEYEDLLKGMCLLHLSHMRASPLMHCRMPISQCARGVQEGR